ncbi:MAG: LamG domain-containing protein [Patescibacteria group bacterium]|nr:LamG domain-containing protein [Patescibacteria group bacterium]
MNYLLLIISNLLDLILLILLIVLIIGIFQLTKSLKREYGLIQKLRVAPKLIAAKPDKIFEQHVDRDLNGTFLASYNKHKESSKLIKRLMAGTAAFLAIKLVVVSLIFLQIPKPSDAQSKYYSALYMASTFNTFTKGTYTLAQWDNDGIDLKPGQLDGNYISVPIGSANAISQWKNLSFKTDRPYGQAPILKNLIATWPLNSLNQCAEAKSKYTCAVQDVVLADGIYETDAYRFDGFRSTVKIEQNVSPAGSFTVAAWIRPAQFILNGNENQNYTIFAKAYGDYTAKTPYAFRYQLFFGIRNGSLTLQYWSDTNPEHWVKVQNNKFNFDADRWYHVAGIYDATNKSLELYIDGIEQSNVLIDYDGGKIDHAPNFKENLPSWIGSSAFRWTDGQEKSVDVFNGTIDHVVLANSVMPLNDIRNLVYSAGRIIFQVRTGDTLPLNGIFFGPKGDPTQFFTNSTANDLSFLPSSKYLQYMCYLSRPDTNFNPKLVNIYIDYLTMEQESDFQISSVNGVNNGSNISRDPVKEKEANDLFYKFFGYKPKSEADQQFVNLLAYGQVSSRNLTLEQSGLSAFVKHYKRLPKSDLDWRLVRALAYCPKGTELLNAWLGKK